MVQTLLHNIDYQKKKKKITVEEDHWFHDKQVLLQPLIPSIFGTTLNDPNGPK